jgi:CDP-diacylglycerol--glycerol-3-phosphate 3-phosphatidyltransferase
MFYFISFLTIIRIIGAPLVLLPWWIEGEGVWIFVSIYFGLLSLTDYFDGMLARKYNMVSNFGKFLDPIGDKVVVLFGLVVLTISKDLNPAFLLIFMTRDFIIGGLRSFAAAEGVVISARALGKSKAALQMVAIPMLLLPEYLIPIPFSMFIIGEFVLIISLILSILSAFDYFLGFRGHWFKSK